MCGTGKNTLKIYESQPFMIVWKELDEWAGSGEDSKTSDTFLSAVYRRKGSCGWPPIVDRNGYYNHKPHTCLRIFAVIGYGLLRMSSLKIGHDQYEIVHSKKRIKN